MIEHSNAPTRCPTRSSFNVRGLDGSLRTDSMRAEPLSLANPLCWPWLLGLIFFDVQSRCPIVTKTSSKHLHRSRWTTDLVIGAWDTRPDDATDQFHVNSGFGMFGASTRGGRDHVALPLIWKPANQEPPPSTPEAPPFRDNAGYLQHRVDAFRLLACLWLSKAMPFDCLEPCSTSRLLNGCFDGYIMMVPWSLSD
jgi:hypothetical protein